MPRLQEQQRPPPSATTRVEPGHPRFHTHPCICEDPWASNLAGASDRVQNAGMITYRLGQAARLLGVSPDTVRRLADTGKLRTRRSPGGQRLVDGVQLAKLAQRIDLDPEFARVSSARNHMLGIVTKVTCDKVAAQVEMRCGPFRLVSLITRESVETMGLQPGVMVHAVVKSTNVVVELADASLGAMAGEDGDASA